MGYVDATGKIVVNPQFESAALFSGGLAAVELAGRYGYINPEGSYAINPQFDAAGPFAEGAPPSASNAAGATWTRPAR